MRTRLIANQEMAMAIGVGVCSAMRWRWWEHCFVNEADGHKKASGQPNSQTLEPKLNLQLKIPVGRRWFAGTEFPKIFHPFTPPKIIP